MNYCHISVYNYAKLSHLEGLNNNIYYYFFPEIFLGTSLIFILVVACILGSSPKYNYPILCYHTNSCLVLVWIFFLLKIDNFYFNNPYFAGDNLAGLSKIFLVLGLLCVYGVDLAKKVKAYEYYVLSLLGLLGLCILVSSYDFLGIYLGLELQTLAFYILATFNRYSAFSTEAGLKYFLLGAISSSLLLFGISIIYGFSGTTNLNTLSFLFLEDTINESSILFFLKIGFFFFSVGFFFKLGIVPFHNWIPDVYEGAPTNVSAIFSVLPKIALFVVLIRFFASISSYTFNTTTFSLALLSVLVGSLVALNSLKIKRLLAYSGISHAGYALIGLSNGSLFGTSTTLFYVAIYIITSVFLWGLLLIVEKKEYRSLYLNDFLNMGKTNSVLGFSACLVVFSIAGIPPLGGFFAKFAIFASSVDLSLYFGTLVGVNASALGILYYLRLVKLLHFEDARIYSGTLISKISGYTLGISAFFLIFFIFFGDLLSLTTYAISSCNI